MSHSSHTNSGSHTLVLNKDNIVDAKNSTLEYKFPTSVNFKNEQIAVAQLQMYYSWENINSSPLNNNIFKYSFPEGATYVEYTITIPDGLYEIADINFYLQSQMIANSHYLVNSKGQNVYYLELKISPTDYSIVANMYSVPTSLPTGFSNPASMPFSSGILVNATTKITIESNNNFKDIIGFESGTYPSTTQTTNQSQKSNDFTPRLIPEVQPNRNIVITCTGISNVYANPQTKIYSIAPDVAIGGYIDYKPPEYLYNDLADGYYNQLRIQFLDKDGVPLNILDPDITILLTIRDKTELNY
jgi:hypothetical protein